VGGPLSRGRSLSVCVYCVYVCVSCLLFFFLLLSLSRHVDQTILHQTQVRSNIIYWEHWSNTLSVQLDVRRVIVLLPCFMNFACYCVLAMLTVLVK